MLQELFDPGADAAVNRVGIQARHQAANSLIAGEMRAAYAQGAPEVRPLLLRPDPGTAQRIAPMPDAKQQHAQQPG
jgi:hypothetical protein